MIRRALAACLVLLAPAAHAACPGPWMPLTRGASWTYRTQSNERITLAVSGVEGKDAFLIATMGTFVESAEGEASSDPVLQTAFLCSSDGLDLPFGVAVAAGKVRVETLKSEGPSLPASLAKGSTWKSTRTMRVTQADRALRSRIVSTHTATGVEKITTPAGTFEAMRVDTESEVTAMTDGSQRTASAIIGTLVPEHATSHAWFAKGVGLVKLSSDAGPASPASPSLELLHVSGVPGR